MRSIRSRETFSCSQGRHCLGSVSLGSLVHPRRARLLTFAPPANAAEEFFVRQSPLYEVVGQLGMWGMLINAVQAASLEHKAIREATWDSSVGKVSFHLPPVGTRTECFCGAGLLVAFTAAMVVFYTTSPILYRLASSVFFNLSLLSSDFFSLLFGE